MGWKRVDSEKEGGKVVFVHRGGDSRVRSRKVKV